jgi:NADP-dependent 3-hydroxy acid dehydrogenase YdfG
MTTSATSTEQRWAGRVALVTGASSGIGRAVARALCARLGMRVGATARRADRLAQLASELADGPGELLPLPADLRDEGQILALFSTLRQRWGGVDVMVNNAGLGHVAPLIAGETDKWREMLEVNVLALCICTREAVQDMQRRGVDGHVIHLSSMGGHRVPKGSGVYAATKFAVRALTEGLRQELRDRGSPVRVTAISPGLVETEFAAHCFGGEQQAREIYGRFKVLEAGDVAEAVLYALGAPPHVQVHDILVRPTDQST